MLRVPTATIDLAALSLQRDGVQHVLTEQEAALLAYLAERPGQVVSRQELLVEVWGYAPQVVTRAIDATVSRLRTKLERTPRQPESLVSVRGKGYQLHVLATPAPPPPAASPAGVLGRGAESTEAEQALASAGVVQLLGPGGAGKTTLARVLCDSHHGLFIDLAASRAVEEVPTAIAQALGMPLSRHTAEDSLARLVTLLSQSPILLVLDNLEQLPEGISPWVAALREGCGVPIVLTSRRVIHPDWPAVQLGPLSPADARTLLVRTARRAAPAWSPDPDEHLDALAEAVDRLPLALELVGARLPALPAATLSTRIEALLHAGDGRAGRQATLATTVSWSWDLLRPIDRRRLAWWSVFRGPLSLQAAEQLGPAEASQRWGADTQAADTVLDTVLRLQAASLLDATRTVGLRPWVAVRAWAAEQLSLHAERDDAEDAHAAWLISRLPDAPEQVTGQARADAIDWIMAHREDLFAAVQRLQQRQPAQAAAIGLRLLLAEGRMVAAHIQQIDELVVRAADRSGVPHLMVSAHLMVARRQRHRRQDPRVVDALASARALLDRHPDAGLDAIWHNLTANHMRRDGHVEASLEHYELARSLALQAGHRRRVASIEQDQSGALRRLRRLDEARALLLRSIAAHRAHGDLRLEALGCQALAAVVRQQGQPDEAIRLGERAIDAARRSGDPFALSEALSAHGNGLIQLDRGAQARQHLTEAVALQRALGNVVALSFALGNLGSVLEQLGDVLEAELHIHEALQTAQSAGVPYAAAFWRFRIAQLTHARGDLPRATAAYERAIHDLDAQEALPQVHYARAFAASAFAEAGDPHRARALLAQAEPLAQAGPHEVAVLAICEGLVARYGGASTAEVNATLAQRGVTLEWVLGEPILHPLVAQWKRAYGV